MLELSESVVLMLSKDYKERFRAEYEQLRTRYLKLRKMCYDWDAGGEKLNFKPTCPRSIYELQLRAMKDYLTILEARAAIEGIDLNAPIEAEKEHAPVNTDTPPEGVRYPGI